MLRRRVLMLRLGGLVLRLVPSRSLVSHTADLG